MNSLKLMSQGKLLIPDNINIVNGMDNKLRDMQNSDVSSHIFSSTNEELIHRFENSKSEHKCGVCNKEGTLICSGCTNKRYCSRECQKSDWKSHKPTCESDAMKNTLKYTLMNQTLANDLARIVPFMEVAASICHLHCTKKTIILFSFIETGLKSWKCKVESIHSDLSSTTPEGHLSYTIRLGEGNTDMKTSMAIPIGICRSDCAKTFGVIKYKLPLNLQINSKKGMLGNSYSIVISDENDRIIKIISTEVNKIHV